MAKKKLEPVQEEKPAEQAVEAQSKQEPVPTENQMVLDHLSRLVAQFEASSPTYPEVEGEDIVRKKYNEKTAQIGGVLLAAAVSVKEIMAR
jgi:uncharacterized membrane-anchored protein